MNSALRLVGQWCTGAGLSVNPNKVVAVPFTRRRNLSGIGPLMLDGVCIPMQKQVKYLGVILDQRLHWGLQLQRVIDRGKWSLLSCRRMVGSVWGLKPALMSWLYVAVVRPAVTYGALVWWTGAISGASAVRLAGVQRLACLMITGAVSSCPGAALNCLLDLLPLDTFIKVVARKSAYRLQCEDLWRLPSEPGGHSRITQEIGGQVIEMPSDRLKTRFTFGKSFCVVIPKRDEWTGGEKPLMPGDKDWFTDGSKGKGGTGAGIFELQSGVGFGIPMGPYPTVFQAEVTAITECAWENVRRGHEGLTINIYSDSQAALKALDSCEFRSRLVWDCFCAVSYLGRHNNVTLCWVPGHSGVEGNEAADSIANGAAASSFTGPNPFCGISPASVNQTIDTWAKKEHSRRWASLPLLRVSKLNLRSPSRKVARGILNLSRSEVRQITGMVTGHGHFRKHLQRMGLYEGDPTCRKCGLQEETADHLLYDCRELEEVRASTLGVMARGEYLPSEELVDRMRQFVRQLEL